MDRGTRTWPTLICLCATTLASLLAGCASDEKLTKAKGLYQSGLAALESDRQQAFVSFQKAVRLNPDHKEAHYYLGHLYFTRGKYDQAAEQFKTVLRIEPDYSDAHNYLGLVLERQGQWEQAIEEYRKALENPLISDPGQNLVQPGTCACAPRTVPRRVGCVPGSPPHQSCQPPARIDLS